MRDGSGGDDDYDDGNEDDDDDEDNDEDNDDEMVFRLSPCCLTPYDDVSLVLNFAASASMSILLLFIVIPISSSSLTFPSPPPPPRLAFHSVFLQFHPALSLSSNWFRSDALRNDSLFHEFIVIFSSSVVALHPPTLQFHFYLIF